MIFDPTRIVHSVGAVFSAYALIFLAVGQFCFGLISTVNESYEFGALGAGLAAFHGYLWWQGGGDRQVEKLRQRTARKDGA